MRIVFIGTVEFSKKALQKLISINAEVAGVCTKENSNFNSDFADLTPLCNESNIPFKFVTDINSKENIDWIISLNPDIVFCFGWSSLIKKELLDLAPMGIVGFHPAKLPQNRGRHPLIWALALGLKQSASTFFFMDEGADSGDILSQKDFVIADTDNAQTLYNKVIDTALVQIEEFIPQLQNNRYQKIKQSHHLANTWRKRGKADGKIDFLMSSEAIYNLVRALTRPYVGAHIEHKEQDTIVWKVRIIENRLKTMQVDEYSMSELIGKISKVVNEVQPNIIYLPFKGDVHSDHRKIFEASYSCTKSFRYPFIKKIYMVETLSETEFAPSTKEDSFVPNVFVDISEFMDRKLEVVRIYESEIAEHPFPRSEKKLKALATLRGATCGYKYAESFILLKEII